jgi:hypothetical protein
LSTYELRNRLRFPRRMGDEKPGTFMVIDPT